jgi:hypothetical protein
MAIKLKDLEIFSDSLGNNFGGNAVSSGGAFNFLGGVIPNIANIANIVTQQQQGPVLGPDDFGSYTIPVSDPTYRSGFDYARSIAGGIPMSQVIAPGVSYSPEQPMGYTQQQLNLPKDVDIPPPPPAILPPTREPDDPRYLGTGIGGVNIPVDRKQIPLRDIMPPLRDIFGEKPDMRSQIRPLENLLNIGKLFGGGIDQDAIDRIVQERIAESMPTFEQPDLSQFVTREDIPSLIPEVPTGREFSIEKIRSGLDLPDFTKFAKQEDIPTIPAFEQPDLSGFVRQEDIPSLITRVPNGSDFSIDREELIRDIREGINIPKYQAPDLSGLARLEDIPKIPSREDFLSIAREGIEIPQYQAPDLSGFARLEDIPSFDPNVLKQDILMSIPQTQVPDVSQFVTQEDIQKAISGIDMPTFQQPDLSAYDTRIAELEQQLAGLQTPTGGRFSVDQQLPRGLF